MIFETSINYYNGYDCSYSNNWTPSNDAPIFEGIWGKYDTNNNSNQSSSFSSCSSSSYYTLHC